ncbi:MAG: cupin domain-containing protein [Alphaproteobacteria bacterium]|nr:cupin domain-containing protein [Alphaproteobacteria bacterium]
MTIRTRFRAHEFDALPFPPGRLSKQAFDDGELELRIFMPRGEDTQTPHDRDELYVVIAGNGIFRRGDERVNFAPGDVLYVAAHETHRFEAFSPDFATWVMFYGPRKKAP